MPPIEGTTHRRPGLPNERSTASCPDRVTLYREGPSVYLSALSSNGRCYGTQGRVILFRSFLPEEIMTHAAEIAGGNRVLAPGNAQLPLPSSSVIGMADLMTTDPVSFLALVQ